MPRTAVEGRRGEGGEAGAGGDGGASGGLARRRREEGPDVVDAEFVRDSDREIHTGRCDVAALDRVEMGGTNSELLRELVSGETEFLPPKGYRVGLLCPRHGRKKIVFFMRLSSEISPYG